MELSLNWRVNGHRFSHRCLFGWFCIAVGGETGLSGAAIRFSLAGCDVDVRPIRINTATPPKASVVLYRGLEPVPLQYSRPPIGRAALYFRRRFAGVVRER